MTEQYKIPMLYIAKCADPMLWYGRMVGKIVPNLGFVHKKGYKSRDPSGFINFVRKADAIPIYWLVPEELLMWPPFNLLRPHGVKK